MTEVFDFAEMPVLTTSRLVLRDVRSTQDAAAVFDLFADPDVARSTDTGPFESDSEAVEVIDWIHGIFASGRGMRWAITMPPSDDLIGTCGFNVWRQDNNSAVIGYDLMQRFWGKGIVPEALRAMLDFGFSDMALNRIEADVTVGNAASVRVLEKLGFHEEGLLRQAGHWRGEYHDLRLFSLLRSEWVGG